MMLALDVIFLIDNTYIAECFVETFLGGANFWQGCYAIYH